MIVLHHFNEAHQHHRQGLIPYRLLQEQAAVLIGICRNPHRAVTEPLEITESDIDWLLQQEEATLDYADFLGGYVHVCETEADLRHIQGCDMEWADAHGGRWPDVTDLPMSWDSCAYLSEPDGEHRWVLFLLCWNDAGGPVYYVPKHLWQAARVEEHIAESNLAWNP